MGIANSQLDQSEMSCDVVINTVYVHLQIVLIHEASCVCVENCLFWGPQKRKKQFFWSESKKHLRLQNRHNITQFRHIFLCLMFYMFINFCFYFNYI